MGLPELNIILFLFLIKFMIVVENPFWGYEDQLVKKFISKYKNKELLFGSELVKGEYFEQIRVPEIGRVSDLIIKCGKRLINVEFKLTDWACVLQQAKDHLKWADYSYVCLPSNQMTHFPQSFCLQLIENGIGLIIGDNNTFTEVFRAKHNTYKSKKIKSFRLNVIERINFKSSVK